MCMDRQPIKFIISSLTLDPKKSTSLHGMSPPASEPEAPDRRIRGLVALLAISFIAFINGVARKSPEPHMISLKDAVSYEVKAATLIDGLTIRTADYGQEPTSAGFLPFDHIAEAYKNCTLTVKHGSTEGGVANTHYRWTIEAVNEKENFHEVVADKQEGESIQVVFDRPGQTYTVKIRARRGDVVKTYRSHVVCKYVRRELRSMTDADRQASLDALEKVHRLSMQEGQKRYGDKFANYAYFAAKHMWKMTLDDCTPFHNGVVFSVAHAAFSFEVEQAMQAVDPKVTLPYWDYTIDDNEYSGSWYALSPIFQSDWFGKGEETKGFLIDEGRFAKLPVGEVGDVDHAPEHNAFGMLTEAFNQNPDKLIGRASSICGLPTTGRLPGCSELEGIIVQDSLSEMHAYMEYDFHRRLHMAVGGAWDCPHSLGDAASLHPEHHLWQKYLGEIATQLNIIWRDMLTLGKDFFSCPTSCGANDTFADCSCRCPELDHDDVFTTGNMTTVQTYLDQVTAMFQISTGCPDCVTENDDGSYSFTNLTDREDLELKRILLSVACHPGKVSQMGTPLAGPNDPLFFPVHNAFERVWNFMRVAPDLSVDWSWSSGPDDCGDMMDFKDKSPFKNFGVGNKPNKTSTFEYTNIELWHLFDPANPELPYVYDSFEWSHCSDNSKTFARR